MSNGGDHAALADLLAEFGRRTSMGELALDEDGLCAVSVDDRLTLHLAADGPGRAVLYVPLSVVHDGDRQTVHTRMLEANLTATSGACLALDPGSGRVVLVLRSRVEGWRYPEFERAVEELLAAAEEWRGELEGSGASGLPRAETATPVVDDLQSLIRYGIRA